jgi:DNA uptake protein ComE-like DNA-binding protein
LLSQNSHLREVTGNIVKPAKLFAVYTDKAKPAPRPINAANTGQTRTSAMPGRSPKRTSSEAMHFSGRAAKLLKTAGAEAGMSKDAIEALIERKVSEALAGRVDNSVVAPQDTISDEMQRRLNALEKRVEGQENERAEGLQYLLMAKQHQVRGEEASALKMYRLALPHFPANEKLVKKIVALQDSIAAKSSRQVSSAQENETYHEEMHIQKSRQNTLPARRPAKTDDDESYYEIEEVADENDEYDEQMTRPKPKTRRPLATHRGSTSREEDFERELEAELTAQTPRTRRLIEIINTKDVSQIRLLKGVGTKKAELIVNCLCDLEDEPVVHSLTQLEKLRGVGVKTVQNMRVGLGEF